MKKKILIILIITIIPILTACNITKVEDTSAYKFKEEYEKVNNEENAKGQQYRKLSIDTVNPFVKITPEELLEKINNNEEFYVYFGSPYCPWCRSVIETCIASAKKQNVKRIYYIDIWNDKREEVLRDKYIINDNNELEQITKGTNTYCELLKIFENKLSNYTLTNKNGEEVEVGEKRIFAPSFIYIKNKTAQTIISGISEKLENPNDELTKEIISDEEEAFNDFFDEDCGC